MGVSKPRDIRGTEGLRRASGLQMVELTSLSSQDGLGLMDRQRGAGGGSKTP